MATTKYYDPGVGDYVILDGNVIERQMLYLVEKIKDYDENIEVLCVDPSLADSPFEEPFQICERADDGQVFRLFGVWELNDSVLERIQFADTQRHNLDEFVQANNDKVRADQEKHFADQAAERRELVTSIIGNHKSSYTFNKDDGAKVTIYDDRPAKVEPVKD